MVKTKCCGKELDKRDYLTYMEGQGLTNVFSCGGINHAIELL